TSLPCGSRCTPWPPCHPLRQRQAWCPRAQELLRHYSNFMVSLKRGKALEKRCSHHSHKFNSFCSQRDQTCVSQDRIKVPSCRLL
ncbi:unnamed protein product, partial [Bubo scandiacus]